MTDNKSITISLGGREFKVSRLPIGVLRDLDAEVADFPTGDKVSPKDREFFFFDQTLNIIAIAVRKSDPDMTVEKLKDLESDMPELFAAREQILRFSGLVREKTPKGEETSNPT